MPKAIVATADFSSSAGPSREVLGRKVQRQIEHLEAEIERRADLVDRRPARRKVVQHLAGHILRESRHTMLRTTP
jgi:hypothetical protein